MHMFIYLYSYTCTHIQRTLSDILLREQLDSWSLSHPAQFNLHYCIGSRWDNIHMGAKTKDEYLPPAVPAELKGMSNASVGWVSEEVIARHGHPPSSDTRYTHVACILYAYNIILYAYSIIMCIFTYNVT